jgi:Domain of unknown function (DUF4280)
MGPHVCMGATLQCSFGLAPSTLVVLPIYPAPPPPPMALRPMVPTPVITTPQAPTPVVTMPVATIADSVPLLNVLPFGMCSSIANPTVASATAAALGVLTPMPCIPVPTGPWAPGSPTVLIGGVPALNSTSKLICAWAGVISVITPGQVSVQVP